MHSVISTYIAGQLRLCWAVDSLSLLGWAWASPIYNSKKRFPIIYLRSSCVQTLQVCITKFMMHIMIILVCMQVPRNHMHNNRLFKRNFNGMHICKTLNRAHSKFKTWTISLILYVQIAFVHLNKTVNPHQFMYNVCMGNTHFNIA